MARSLLSLFTLFFSLSSVACIPRATYTRGVDLSSSLAEAGGIGGLLARTDGSGSTFYHADVSGNITGLIDGQQNMAARYMYSAFGNTILQGGLMGPVNRMTFSSKERLAQAPDIYDYGWRYWFTGPGRWGSRDPLGEGSDVNLYRGMGNNPLNRADPYGLTWAPFSGEAWEQLWSDAKQAVQNFFMGNQTPQPLDPNSNQALRNNEGVGPTQLTDANGNPVSPGQAVTDIGMAVPEGFLQAAMMLPLGPEEAGAAAAGDAARAAKAAKCKKAPKWIWSNDKSVPKMLRQMQQRGWTPQQITEAMQNGEQFPALNLVNPGNPATRYVNPTTGQSVVVDNVTGEVLHVGGPGFKY